MTSPIETILSLSDQGESVAAIAAASNVSPGQVYTALRRYRPNRQRKPRTRTSEKRRLILGLLAQRVEPPRVAFLARCSASYVYQLIDQESAATSR